MSNSYVGRGDFPSNMSMSHNDAILSPKGSHRGVESFSLDSVQRMMEKMGMRETAQHKMPLQYNAGNLVKTINLPNQLSQAEKEILNEKIKMEKQYYQEMANERFDSTKNWSIMIEPACNDERNEIMRKFKFQQYKKHKLHEFTRKERELIIKERKEREAILKE